MPAMLSITAIALLVAVLALLGAWTISRSLFPKEGERQGDPVFQAIQFIAMIVLVLLALGGFSCAGLAGMGVIR